MIIDNERAYGKINLTLDILGLRDDGYHEVEMIMQSISLYDEVNIVDVNGDGEIVVISDSPELSEGKENLVYKAAKLLQSESSVKTGLVLELKKNIPIAAGLGGGSSDAAATLRLLNRYWKLNFTNDELRELGAKIGADVPFCIEGGSAFAYNVGDKIRKLENIGDFKLLLIKPEEGVSTKVIYDEFDHLGRITKDSASREMLSFIEKNRKFNSLKQLTGFMKNDLQEVTATKCKDIQIILDEITDNNGFGMMTGSGPTVMAFFTEDGEYERMFKYFKQKHKETYIICFFSNFF